MAQSRTSPAIFSFDFQFRPFSTAAGTRSRVPAEVPARDRFLLLKEASNATSALSPTFSALLGALTYVDTWMLERRYPHGY
jgi:hypothetical protein